MASYHDNTHPSNLVESTVSEFSISSATKSQIKLASFLGLPREIRNKVYALLLHTKRYDQQRQFNHHGLHLSILRVNKQVNFEATKTLYEENGWVLLRMDWHEHAWLGGLAVLDKNTVHHMPYLIRVDVFLGTPILEVSLRHKDANRDRILWPFILSAYSLPQFARVVTKYFPENEARLEIRLATSAKRASWTPEKLLDPFRDIRGLKGVLVEGCEPNLQQEIVASMTKALKSTKELLERARTYLQSGQRYLQAGCPCQARDTFYEGTEYIWWLYVDPLRGTPIHRDRDPLSDYQQLMNVTYKELTFACIDSCILIGDAEEALTLADRLYRMRKKFYSLTSLEETKCYLYSGTIHFAAGALNTAAYSFLCALRASPGHEAGSKAVEALYARVKDSPILKHGIVKYNIENIIQPFRTDMDKEDPHFEARADEICSGFVGEIKEMGVLLSPSGVSSLLFCRNVFEGVSS